MFCDVGSRFYELRDLKEFYCLLTGKSYREIGIKFYSMQIYKFIYKVRRLLKAFNLQNRRQLAFYAVKNKLVSLEKLKRFQ